MTGIGSRLAIVVFIAGLAGIAARADADVTKITIVSRSVWLGGRSFGAIGPYEEVKGFAIGEIDPKDPRNVVITDIELASRNAKGKVEYRTTFTLRKPIDMSKASGVLFYNVVNRGNKAGPATWDVGGDPGDGFMYNLGQVLLWSGWQGDMPIATLNPDREGIDVPIARNPDGSAVTGPVVERFINVAGNVNTQPLAGAGRMPAGLDTTKAKFISAVSETQSGVKGGVRQISSGDWAFADCRTVPFPGTPDPTRVCLKSGFDPALLYELVYTAKDPYILGVGMAAMRDVVSFFRYTEKDAAGTANPIFGQVPHVLAMGSSQSGRFAKAFLNLGFNQDEHGRIVWDGLNARIAGMLGSFNTRFAQPGDISELYLPGAEGPLWWADYEDKVRGLPAWGLLHRCTATNTCPKITETYGGPEYWYSRGTVGIAGTTGKEDLPLPANVRRYYHAGTPHGGGAGGFTLGTRSADPNAFANNPNPERETDRALYVALVDWVVKGTPPPPSVYPRVSDGTLVPATSAAMGWPNIPNSPKPDGVINAVLDYDYGPGYRYNDSSGVMTNVPPPVKRIIPTLVPKVDADGNDKAGVKSLLFSLPLGTYTDWNPIASGVLKGRERSLAGGYIPFAKTKAERLASGDPRPSIEERYPSLAAYYEAATSRAAELVKQRLLLPEDAARLVKQVRTDMEASKLLSSQTPATADQGAAAARGGRGGRGGVVHTLSPGPDLGYTYDINPLPLPPGMEYASQIGAVAMNSKGHIFVYHRATAGKPQLLEFDEHQKFVRGFGADIAVRAHGMRIDAQDNIWICDQGGNTVMKLNPQGQVIMTLGERGKLGAWDEAAGTKLLFNPTDVAIAPNGDIYIAQGHGAESPPGVPRVLRLDKNGKYITQWSGNVEGPGKFAMVHSITLDPKGNVYLADREDKRIVIYDANGKFIRTIQMANLVCGFMVTKGNELWMSNGQDGQVEKIDWDGHVLGWTGTGPGNGVGQFGESNFMAMDAVGDIYVGDTVYGRVEKLIRKK